MNREIRFRAWDKKRNIMIGDDYPKNWGNNTDEWYFDLAYMQLTGIEEISNDENHIVMQYTGLKDKNGVEIYEDDLLKIELDWGYGPAKILSKVYFENGCFRAKALNSHEDTLLIELPPCEAIGNIYENSDLLEGAK